MSALEQPVPPISMPRKSRRGKYSPPFRIAPSIMPRYRALFHLNMAPGRPLCIIPKDFRNLRHPTHIQILREIDPLDTSPLSNEPTMLRAASSKLMSAYEDVHPLTTRKVKEEDPPKSNIPEVSQMLFKERAISPRNDIHDIFRIRREPFQCLKCTCRRHSHRRRLDDRSQRALHI